MTCKQCRPRSARRSSLIRVYTVYHSTYYYITKTFLFKYLENFTIKKWKFSDEKFWYFSYFCSKHRFLSRNKKNNVYPCKPQFYYIKVGFKGVKFTWCKKHLQKKAKLRSKRYGIKCLKVQDIEQTAFNSLFILALIFYTVCHSTKKYKKHLHKTKT